MTPPLHPLSPIILAKNADQTAYGVTQQDIFLQAHLKNDIFDIYHVVNSSSKNYCDKLKAYICTSGKAPTGNDYYNCPDGNITAIEKNEYVVIEFINPASFIKFSDTKTAWSVENKYYIRKITFHAPSYHYVTDVKAPDVNIYDTNRGKITTLPGGVDKGTKHNCMEIEFMCSTDIADTPLIISVLCHVNMNETITDALLFESDYSPAFTTLNNYLIGTKHSQLKNGGFRNSKYTFNCNDLFPTNKHFYKYNGTTFKTNSSGDLRPVTRIVFEDSIQIPKTFYDNIHTLTKNNDCNTILNINKFINVNPEEHQIKYSQTNIDFNVEKNTGNKKKNNITTLYVIIILFVLFLLIMLFFAWHEGILKNALKQIFKENLVLYQLISKYI